MEGTDYIGFLLLQERAEEVGQPQLQATFSCQEGEGCTSWARRALLGGQTPTTPASTRDPQG